jgi:hypothetical protein
MNNKRDYYEEERRRIAQAEIKAARPIFRIERGMDERLHVLGMLRNGKIIHETAYTREEAEDIVKAYGGNLFNIKGE